MSIRSRGKAAATKAYCWGEGPLPTPGPGLGFSSSGLRSRPPLDSALEEALGWLLPFSLALCCSLRVSRAFYEGRDRCGCQLKSDDLPD